MSSIQKPVRISNRRITTQDNMVTIDYPVVKGMESPTAQHRINRAVVSLVDTIMREQGYYKNQKLEMLGWYEIKTNERGILSMTIGNYSFIYPSAHGMTIVKALTFELKSGDAVELNSLFKPEADYVKVLSDIVDQQIKDRDIELLDEFKGIRPDQDFYIADKSLVLFFQLYEITPYYMGLQYFPISVYQIQDIITEEGPLGIMASGD
ncbi:MAG: hypothetical protein APF77_19900 [Clostridia bacterium BRH_c25]|nr:MAG: hypothetical protein APF77_19900 [Clostridia bacterium BRH_c25]